MSNTDVKITHTMIDRAVDEIKLDAVAREGHKYWYTGHKNKARRAIQMARDMLLELRKEIDNA